MIQTHKISWKHDLVYECVKTIFVFFFLGHFVSFDFITILYSKVQQY
jgi:hypothetical protein